jgi:hypothetical protein
MQIDATYHTTAKNCTSNSIATIEILDRKIRQRLDVGRHILVLLKKNFNGAEVQF